MNNKVLFVLFSLIILVFGQLPGKPEQAQAGGIKIVLPLPIPKPPNNGPPKPGFPFPLPIPPKPTVKPPHPPIPPKPTPKPIPPSKNITLDNGNLVVTIPVDGRVPFYTLSQKDSNVTYNFSFCNLYEQVKLPVINKWKKVFRSEVPLRELKWTTESTSNTSFTMTGVAGFGDQFKRIQLVNKFQTGVVNGICNNSVKNTCVSKCTANCADVGLCVFGCEIGGINNVDTCSSSCSNLGDTCLNSCLQTVDCITRGCSSYLKIDLFIQGYKFVSILKESRLVFKYSVTGRNTATPVKTGDTLTFGNFWVQFNTSSFALPPPCTDCGIGSCLCSNNTAVISNITSTVKNDSARVNLFFNRFTSGYTLINDPRIGLSTNFYSPQQASTRSLGSVKASSSSVLAGCFLLALFLSLLFF